MLCMKRLASLLFLPQGDILSAGFIIMGLSLMSGILGLLRDKLLSWQFTPDLTAIYFASFIIPENVFQILILGALGSAFIPVFSKYHNDESRWDFALSFLHLSVIVFLAFLFLAFLFAEPLSILLVPGLAKENPAHLALLINLTRIILVSQMFFVVSYLFTAILQSFQRFFIPALGPIFYNLGIVLGIVFLAPRFGMYGVGMGVVVGAMLHLLVQAPFVGKMGFRYHVHMDLSHKGISEIIRLMIPRTMSLVLERAKLTTDTILASLISLSSITFLNFASHVAIFPIALFANALAQAAFPFLTRARANNNMTQFRDHICVTLTHIAFFLVPTSVLFITLHTPLVRLAFGSRQFSWEATSLTSWTLVLLSFSLVFQGAGTLLARGFYALYDTKTPLIVTFTSLFITVLLSLIFVLLMHLPVWSLALSTTIGSIVNAGFLFVLLDKRIGGLGRLNLSLSLGKILFISVLLYGFSYGSLKFFEQFFDTTYTLPLLIFSIIVTLLSGGFYMLLSFIFNLEEYQALAAFLHTVRRVPKKFFAKEVIVNGSKLTP